MGHSTHERGTFAALVRGHGVRAIADVRRYPGSRRLPHFNAEALAAWLAEDGIAYHHLPELGGRRSRVPESVNGGWENAAFQGYADHMARPEFAAALERLEALARERPAAVMCAEAPWWRCHRRLLADALLERGWRVEHILPDGRLSAHELTPFADLVDGRLTYPAPQGKLV